MLAYFPASPGANWRKLFEPMYETFAGWNVSTENVRRMEDLPANARVYLERLEEVSGVPISLVSVSPKRPDYILRDERLLSYDF